MQSSRCLGFRWRVLASGFSLDLLCSGFRGLHRLWRHCGRCPLRQVIERHVIDPLIGRRQLLFHDGPGYLASELLIWGLSPRFTWRFAKRSRKQSGQFIRPDREFRQSVPAECLGQRDIGGIAAARDQNSRKLRFIVPGIEHVPFPRKEYLHPRGKITGEGAGEVHQCRLDIRCSSARECSCSGTTQLRDGQSRGRHRRALPTSAMPCVLPSPACSQSGHVGARNRRLPERVPTRDRCFRKSRHASSERRSVSQ